MVARGFSQIDLDYTDIYSLVAKFITFRSMLLLTVQRNRYLYQIDVKQLLGIKIENNIDTVELKRS